MSAPTFDPTTLAKNATQAADKMFANAEALEPMAKAFAATAQAWSEHPHKLMQQNLTFFQQQMALSANVLELMQGKQPAPVVEPEKGDRRFAHPAWQTAWFDLLKQSYLLTSRHMLESVAETEGMDKRTHQQALFYTRQLAEMLSPTNLALTNPEVMTTALESNGESLQQGMANLLKDIEQGRISMTDYDAFEVGTNIAVTPGKVVFKNRMMELIRYAPQTETVHDIPLLICPPWINRYYILDLQPHNSLVNYLVQQGFQVFMISWKNPDASYRDTTFEDYLNDGFLAASDVVMAITGQKHINTLGYCIGGAMLGCAAAILNSKKDTRIHSAAFLTSLLDYADPGELGVFIDEDQLDKLDTKMEKEGILDGRDMAATFSALRATDLMWNYVVNNYMLGKQPPAFDILYWNDDSTRMPAAMHSWYLRNFYLENNIAKKGRLTLLGTPLDITNITQPVYMMSGRGDHITPWGSCYKPFAALKSGWKRFILSPSGHVAGVVNPPTPQGKPVKKTLLAGDAKTVTAEGWLHNAEEVKDSWWPDYAAWLKPLSGEEIKAPKSFGNKDYRALYDAPGVYVKER